MFSDYFECRAAGADVFASYAAALILALPPCPLILLISVLFVFITPDIADAV
jgi:hypothetical protein